MAQKNSNLSEAKKNKNDEFYTRLVDISKELSNYTAFFKGKVVLCNCDDPEWSNFWIYFHQNFGDLELKKLISTHYEKPVTKIEQVPVLYKKGKNKGQPMLDDNGNQIYEEVEITVSEKQSYMMEYDGGNDIDVKCWKQTTLKGNGDFRSEECIEILKQADIVVTNPPFSLFREYVAQLMEYEKKFIIIGNKNAITYKEYFPLLKDNKVWIGYTSPNEFLLPDGSITKQVTGLTRWFTNIDIQKRHEPLVDKLQYQHSRHLDWYKKYDNYDAINVDKVDNIPYDYFGMMGVPITFLDKYNPDEFEIIGLLQSSTDEQAGIPNLRYYNDFKEMRQDMTFTGASGGKANGNPVIKGKSLKGNFLYCEKTDEYVHSVYARIVIKRKENTIK